MENGKWQIRRSNKEDQESAVIVNHISPKKNNYDFCHFPIELNKIRILNLKIEKSTFVWFSNATFNEMWPNPIAKSCCISIARHIVIRYATMTNFCMKMVYLRDDSMHIWRLSSTKNCGLKIPLCPWIEITAFQIDKEHPISSEEFYRFHHCYNIPFEQKIALHIWGHVCSLDAYSSISVVQWYRSCSTFCFGRIHSMCCCLCVR